MSEENQSYRFFDDLIALVEDPCELTSEIKKRIKQEIRKISYLKRKIGKSVVKTMPIPREIRENPKFVYALSVA